MVDKLKAAVQRGEVDAQALDATNPERHWMMEAWCESADSKGEAAKERVCKRVAMHKDFIQRREILEAFWCVEKGNTGSPKCKQMDYGKKMYSTVSGADRQRLTTEFKASGAAASTEDMEAETKKMMAAICASPKGKAALFKTTCSRLHSEL